MSTEKMAIFDLDGTLNDVISYAIDAFYMAMETEQIESNITREQVISMFGAPWHIIAKTAFPNILPDQIKRFNDVIDKYEFELIKERGRTFPGTVESLQKLRDNGYVIVVCSNAKINYIDKVSESIKIDHLIDYKQELHNGFIKNDMVKLILDKFQPKKAIMVGDRFYDKDAAKSNNIPFIGCLYGCAPDEMIDAEYKIESATEIADMVMDILEK